MHSIVKSASGYCDINVGSWAEMLRPLAHICQNAKQQFREISNPFTSMSVRSNCELVAIRPRVQVPCGSSAANRLHKIKTRNARFERNVGVARQPDALKINHAN